MTFSIRTLISAAKTQAARIWRSPVRMLIAAGIFHLALTVAIYAAGRVQVFPSTFDENGIGVSFAIDGLMHRADAQSLSELLRAGELREWFWSPYPLHNKLYSICFALLGPWLGTNIISAEPLNLLYYLGVLILVYKIGTEVFGKSEALFAAVIVGMWPSFLLHTTQLLKDPLIVCAMLAFVLIALRYLTRDYAWRASLLAGLFGGMMATTLWLVRDGARGVAIAILLVAAAMLLGKQIAKRSLQLTNVAGMGLLIITMIGAQQLLPTSRGSNSTATRREALAPEGTISRGRVEELDTAAIVRRTSLTSRFVISISVARSRFISRYPDAGSNIDSDVLLIGPGDMVRYLPRAAMIGLFAPFPTMWFSVGKEVGRTGRLLAGLETIALYLFEACALFALWHRRRSLPVWFLLASALTGMIALGLVVVNAAALFRMRYAFVILVIVVGVDGLLRIIGLSTKRQRDPTS